jgi:hypothetical protein
MPNISKTQIEQTIAALCIAEHADEGECDAAKLMLQGLLSQPEQLSKDALIDIICQHTALTYHCTRTWQAWGVGTMTQDDFEEVNESDLPDELADAILAKITTHPAPFTPITADMVTDEMLAQVHKANTEAISGYSEKLLFAKVVNAYMGAKK